MAIVGDIAVILVGLAIIAGLVLGVFSLPDIRRYLRIRKM